VALGAPLALGLFPRVRLPAIVLGIVIGPQVLGWVSIDTPIQVMSLLGLAFLLLLAGLEVEYERFRGHLLRLTAVGYAISFGLALLIGLGPRECKVASRQARARVRAPSGHEGVATSALSQTCSRR
jgi:Kef-type K+ transport system membrane component KefB